MPPLLFEIIMSNQCNRRCEYCKLDFYDQHMPKKYLDDMIGFLETASGKVPYCMINFFGGEPLLNIEGIKYFVENTQHISNIKYSVGTNGLILNAEVFAYLNRHDFQIYLSIDTQIADAILSKQFLQSDLSRVQLNFIVNPNSIEQSFELFDRCIAFGFTHINILPVMFSIPWDARTLALLKQFVVHKIIPHQDSHTLNLLNYYNGMSAERQYVLDSDGQLYSDLDSLLWIQKQGDVLPPQLKAKIHSTTQLGALSQLTPQKVVDLYDTQTILKLVHEIPKTQGFLPQYHLISQIFDTNRYT